MLIHVLTTTKPVEGSYKLGKIVLTAVNPVESLWSCCKQVQSLLKPCMQRFGKPVLSTAILVEGLWRL